MNAVESWENLVYAVLLMSMVGGFLGSFTYACAKSVADGIDSALRLYKVQKQYRDAKARQAARAVKFPQLGVAQLPMLVLLVVVCAAGLQACASGPGLFERAELTAHDLWIQRIKGGY